MLKKLLFLLSPFRRPFTILFLLTIVYEAGQVFYWGPGHAPEALEDAEYVLVGSLVSWRLALIVVPIH